MNSLIVYKYPLELSIGPQTLQLHRYSKILKIDCQNKDVFLWALVDTKQNLVNRRIQIVTTGERFEAASWEINYINSFVADDWFVAHAFELDIRPRDNDLEKDVDWLKTLLTTPLD